MRYVDDEPGRCPLNTPNCIRHDSHKDRDRMIDELADILANVERRRVRALKEQGGGFSFDEEMIRSTAKVIQYGTAGELALLHDMQVRIKPSVKCWQEL